MKQNWVVVAVIIAVLILAVQWFRPPDPVPPTALKSTRKVAPVSEPSPNAVLIALREKLPDLAGVTPA